MFSFSASAMSSPPLYPKIGFRMSREAVSPNTLSLGFLVTRVETLLRSKLKQSIQRVDSQTWDTPYVRIGLKEEGWLWLRVQTFAC